MARRVTTVKIVRDGRDKGKTFVLTELPAEQAEMWFMRASMLLARSGAEVPPDMFKQSIEAFAALGIGAILSGFSKAPWSEVKPLVDEMFSCVAFQSPNGDIQRDPYIVSSQIEEVETRLRLREEVLSLHLGFSLAARLSALRQMVTNMTASNTRSASTSADTSPSSSEAA